MQQTQHMLGLSGNGFNEQSCFCCYSYLRICRIGSRQHTWCRWPSCCIGGGSRGSSCSTVANRHRGARCRSRVSSCCCCVLPHCWLPVYNLQSEFQLCILSNPIHSERGFWALLGYAPQRLAQGSQVPQPTCYWKWVGVTIPLKHHNFTLRASRAFNMARTLEQVYFLESSVYGEQFFS